MKRTNKLINCAIKSSDGNKIVLNYPLLSKVTKLILPLLLKGDDEKQIQRRMSAQNKWLMLRKLFLTHGFT
jgi:hypothetical protein